jgi:hypothetical protein
VVDGPDVVVAPDVVGGCVADGCVVDGRTVVLLLGAPVVVEALNPALQAVAARATREVAASASAVTGPRRLEFTSPH